MQRCEMKMETKKHEERTESKQKAVIWQWHQGIVRLKYVVSSAQVLWMVNQSTDIRVICRGVVESCGIRDYGGSRDGGGSGGSGDGGEDTREVWEVLLQLSYQLLWT